MNVTSQLHNLGQSLWLDDISRELLTSGRLEHYVDDLMVCGMTSNPTIFARSITAGHQYADSIRRAVRRGRSDEEIFFDIALEDVLQAAEILDPIHWVSAGVDGWVSLEISPLLDSAADMYEAARALHERASCANLLIKVPGTRAGLEAVEECIFAGVPVNVTLLFSPGQYVAAAEAYMRGLERRLQVGLDLRVSSVASLFVSRWDVAVRDQVWPGLRNRLGIAVGRSVYRAYRGLLAGDRWRDLANAGARPQRLLWASTSTKDPNVRDTLYVEALAAPDTINTVPERTLLAFADHGRVRHIMPSSGAETDPVLETIGRAGVDVRALAAWLQEEGLKSFSESWRELMSAIRRQSGQRARSKPATAG